VKAAALLLLLTALPASADPTQADFLLAARCIGAEEALATGTDHIRPDQRLLTRLEAGFESIAGIEGSPPAAKMEAARQAGRVEATKPPDPFMSIEEIMAGIGPSAECLRVIDRFGLVPVVYPLCFADGCP
jgi:hypothetical protein